jgi:hypothetical protein
VFQYPADGVGNYGGWVMPQAWDVEDAWLEIAEPSVPDPLLTRYRDCPHSLMMYSTPTPPEGVVAEVAVVDEANRESSCERETTSSKLSNCITTPSRLGVGNGRGSASPSRQQQVEDYGN